MDVRGDDGEEEEEAVDDDVFVQAREEHDRDGREEDVEDANNHAFEHGGGEGKELVVVVKLCFLAVVVEW